MTRALPEVWRVEERALRLRDRTPHAAIADLRLRLQDLGQCFEEGDADMRRKRLRRTIDGIKLSVG